MELLRDIDGRAAAQIAEHVQGFGLDRIATKISAAVNGELITNARYGAGEVSTSIEISPTADRRLASRRKNRIINEAENQPRSGRATRGRRWASLDAAVRFNPTAPNLLLSLRTERSV